MNNHPEQPTTTRYQLYCCDISSAFTTEVSVLKKASTGITTPEYVSFVRNGTRYTGFLKKDENKINENDVEFVLSRIGNILSVSMAEVIRTYEDQTHAKPHSIISISVAQREYEQFICFSDIQNELFEDLKSGTIGMTPWLENWIHIRKRRENNPPGVWDVQAESTQDYEACLCYPFEIAERWTLKHRLKLLHFDEDILKMVMLDILVGQTDRTTGNYGLLIDWQQQTAKLAPLFDNSTLRKPDMNEFLNGFNYLLMDRTDFAVAAYLKWPEAFLSCATDILSREEEIFWILDSSGDLLSQDKLLFLKNRIRDSMVLLERIVNNHSRIETLQALSHIDVNVLREEIKQVFTEHGLQPAKIEQLGEANWEPKFHVVTANHSYFVKFSLYDRFSDDVLDLMRMVQQHIPSVLIPLITQNVPTSNRQVNVYPWIEGVELRELIKTKTPSECYQLGIRCGKLLKDIHNTTPTQLPTTFNVGDRLSDCLKVISRRSDLLPRRSSYLSRVQEWKKLLCRQNQVALVHMDFVPKNIMVCSNELVVIDWDSCIIADPWLDFFDKGLAMYPERQALNAGEIDGYFEGNVPPEFWPYFKALSIFALIQSAAWAINRNDTANVDPMETILCDSYENFERDIPAWYEQYTQR